MYFRGRWAILDGFRAHDFITGFPRGPSVVRSALNSGTRRWVLSGGADRIWGNGFEIENREKLLKIVAVRPWYLMG